MAPTSTHFRQQWHLFLFCCSQMQYDIWTTLRVHVALRRTHIVMLSDLLAEGEVHRRQEGEEK